MVLFIFNIDYTATYALYIILTPLSTPEKQLITSVYPLLSTLAPQLPKSNMKKLFQDVYAIQLLLREFETCVARQNEQLKCLKVQFVLCCCSCLSSPLYKHGQYELMTFVFQEFEGSFQNYFESLKHLKDNVPKYMPKRYT